MKRSELVAQLADEIRNCINMGGCPYMVIAGDVLKKCEEVGMLPPTQAPSLIDCGDGTQKHGPAQRIWDEE